MQLDLKFLPNTAAESVIWEHRKHIINTRQDVHKCVITKFSVAA